MDHRGWVPYHQCILYKEGEEGEDGITFACVIEDKAKKRQHSNGLMPHV